MRAAVLGYSLLKFKDHWDKSIANLLFEVCDDVLKKSNVKNTDVDFAFVANCFSNATGVVYDKFGITEFQVKSDIAGSLAIKQGAESISSGKNKIVLVAGAEKASDFTFQQLTRLKLGLIDEDEAENGATLEGLYGLIAKKYLQDFGLTHELASISLKSYKNAVANEFAWIRKEFNIENILASPPVAEPLRLLEAAPFCDGAAAILLGDQDVAKSFKDPYFIIGSGIGNDTSKLSERKNFISMQSTSKAFEAASNQAKLKVDDISIAEVHDLFSISEAIAVEDLGFCEKGKGAVFAANNKINLSGGLKACGHAPGATGIRQAIDVIKRLEKGYGLSHSVSGVGSICIVNIFGK